MRRLLLLPVLVIGLAACGEATDPGLASGARPPSVEGPEPGPTTSAPPPSIAAPDPGPTTSGAPPSIAAPDPGRALAPATRLPVGRSFVATAASEGGRDRPLVAQVSIGFEEGGTTGVSTGCNGGGGTARLRDGRLITEPFAFTAMGCPGPAEEQQEFVSAVVQGEPEVLLGGDVLVLRTAKAEIRFLDRKRADPDRPLEGTRWRVTSVFDAQDAGSVGNPPGHLILSGGRARFTGACRDLEGPATVTGSTVRFGALSTRASRPCDHLQQEFEAGVVRHLAGSTQATVQAGSLRLEGPKGSGLRLVEDP